ncbi:hypothetical protein [Streptomyces sp. NPDC101165]
MLVLPGRGLATVLEEARPRLFLTRSRSMLALPGRCPATVPEKTTAPISP